jgi:hypothetical protein
VSFDVSALSDEERRQYKILEDLFVYSYDTLVDEKKLCQGILQTLEDWQKKMGGRSELEICTLPYIEKIQLGDKESARNLYLFISPLFFYIHVLFEISRAEWRNAISWSGMYCERIVKNLLREFDRCYFTSNYIDVLELKFANKLGRLRSKLEEKKIDPGKELCNLMEVIYSHRSTRGPHDVPPPDPLKAQISAGQCLPVYIDYLDTLILLKNPLSDSFTSFVNFFGSLTETKISLAFGEDAEKVTVEFLIKSILYREGFFKEGKHLAEIQTEIRARRYNFNDPAVSKALSKLSKGREAVLTQSGKKRYYSYRERYPPAEYFRKILR